MKAKNVFIAGTVGIFVISGIILYSSFLSFSKTGKQKAETPEPEPEILSIAGRVVSVNAADNSFVVLESSKEKGEFKVRLGEKSEFSRLVFPFDISSAPEEAAFSPEKETVTIEDLKTDDQVFVRSAFPVKKGQEIVNPPEVQILP